MKRSAIVLIISILAVGGSSAGEIILQKEISGISSIDISVASSDVILSLTDGDVVTIEVESSYPEGVFIPQISQVGSNLDIEDEFDRVPGRNFNFHGTARYVLKVPRYVSIDISSASGDLTIERLESDVRLRSASGDIEMDDFKGTLNISTASGDIELNNSEGVADISTASGDIRVLESELNLEASTASGDVILRTLTGNLNVSTASGDVDADGITLRGETELSSASGDLLIELAGSLGDGVELSTASGNIYLDVDRKFLDGVIELTARNKRGTMSTPFTYDQEEVYKKWGKEFVTRTSTLGNSDAYYLIETSSGRIKVNTR